MLASTAHQTSAVARLAELSLPGRVQVGLTTPAPVPRLPSGRECIDALLDGGIPRGRVSEVYGPLSSGKTSLVCTWLATTTRRGEVVACVDLTDALDPMSIALAGADLQRVLWVRPPSVTDGLRCTELLLQAGGFAVVVLDLGATVPRPMRHHVWPRFMRAAEQSHTALIILAPHRVAGSCAVLGLTLRPRTPCWQRGAWPLFDGFATTLAVERSKLGTSEAKSVKLKVESQSQAFSFHL